jgi:hypothetical protein
MTMMGIKIWVIGCAESITGTNNGFGPFFGGFLVRACGFSDQKVYYFLTFLHFDHDGYQIMGYWVR